MRRVLGLGMLFVLVSVLSVSYMRRSCSSPVCVNKALNAYVVSDYTSKIDAAFPFELPISQWSIRHSVDATLAKEQFAKAFAEASDEKTAKNVSVSQYLSYALEFYLRDTEFKGRFTVNSAPKEGHVNFYLLKKDPQKVAPNFELGCQYIGFSNAIICDEQFLQTIFRIVDNYARPIDIVTITPQGTTDTENSMGVVRSTVKSGMLAWLIGHEIGHAVLHRSEVLRESKTLHFSGYTYDKTEREADAFISKKMGKDINIATVYKLSLTEFLQHEYRHYVDEDTQFALPDGSKATARQYWYHYQLPLVVPIKVDTAFTQYPLLLRVLGMLMTMSEEIEGLDNTGFFHSINKNIDPPVNLVQNGKNL